MMMVCDARCSFCGCSPSEAAGMVQGKDEACICADCTGVALQMLVRQGLSVMVLRTTTVADAAPEVVS